VEPARVHIESGAGQPSSSGVSSTAEQHLRSLLQVNTALASLSTEEDLFRKVLDSIFEVVPAAVRLRVPA